MTLTTERCPDERVDDIFLALGMAEMRLRNAHERLGYAENEAERQFYNRVIASEQKQVDCLREYLGLNDPFDPDEILRLLGIDLIGDIP